MGKQHIPTAFPPDKELLDALDVALPDSKEWVCRPDAAYGMTIHGIPPRVAKQYGWTLYPNVRAALAAGLGLTQGD